MTNTIDTSDVQNNVEVLPLERVTGTISTIAPATNHGGKGFGFIDGENGESYYFGYLTLDTVNNKTAEEREQLMEQFNSFKKGDQVTFQAHESERGLHAHFVQKVGEESTATNVIIPAVSASVASNLPA